MNLEMSREDVGPVGHLHPSGAAAGTRLKAAGQLQGNQTPRSCQANQPMPRHNRHRVCVSADFYPVLFDKCRDKDFDFIPIWTAPSAESPASAKV